MIKKYFYNCYVTLGSISTLETDTAKKALELFLQSFSVTDYDTEKIPSRDGEFYHVQIRFEHFSALKRDRFMHTIITFCLYWNIALVELN